MCGICGFTGEMLDLNDRKAVIKHMTDVITHRGPDSDGEYFGDGVTMGFRRLSIIDIASTGDQPIYNEDRTLVITFNGEIYNYQDLRRELLSAGHTFTTQTDTETILHGFEEWGEHVLDHLRGMFAFAIWNTKTKRLFLARDFFGIKPLYYCTVNGQFVYGSEIKSLLEMPGFEKKLNLDALQSYLSFEYVVPPQTLFEGVEALMPAHYLWVSADGSVDVHRYWDPQFEPDESMTEGEAVDLIDKTFLESVDAHRIADVEVGCFLSSGVDSSWVASNFAGQKAFTVGFGEDERYNEIGYAKTLAEAVGIEHHTKVISPEEYWNAIPKVQYHLDQPSADASCIALYFVSKIASEYVKVVLSGEGADELFGGYNIYHEPADLAAYQRLPLPLRKAAASIVEHLPNFRGKSFLIRGSKTVEERFIGNCSMFTERERRAILRHEIPLHAPQELTKPIFERCQGFDDVTKMQYLDLHVWLIGDILLKADRMSMANSLELRVPFLDRRVWDVAKRIPSRLRVNAQNTKVTMRKAAARHLPEATSKKKKLGFPVPIRVWLREEPYVSKVSAAFESADAQKFFQTPALLRLLDAHAAGKADNSRKIWTVYMFLVWYGIYFSGTQH